MDNPRRAFSTIEYTVFIAFVIVALLGAFFYLRRGLSGKWRAVGDTFGHGRVYSRSGSTCYNASGTQVSCN